MSLSEKRKVWRPINGECYLEDDVKEFIKMRFKAIEEEQKEAKSRETKRALLNLKAKLEEDSGDDLI